MSSHVSVTVTLVTLTVMMFVGFSVMDAVNESYAESDAEAETLDEAAQERMANEFQRAVETMTMALTGFVASLVLGRGVNDLARHTVATRASLTP